MLIFLSLAFLIVAAAVADVKRKERIERERLEQARIEGHKHTAEDYRRHISESRNLCLTTIKLDVFVSRYAFACQRYEELIDLARKVPEMGIDYSKIETEYKNFLIDRDKFQKVFIAHVADKTGEKVKSLKTRSAKTNNVEKFISEMMELPNISESNKAYINELSELMIKAYIQ